MKFSASLLSAIFLVTIAWAMYQENAGNALPYQYLLDDTEIENFIILSTQVTYEELQDLIKTHLIAKGTLEPDDDEEQSLDTSSSDERPATAEVNGEDVQPGANQEDRRPLPYQHLLNEDEITTYQSMVGAVEDEELSSLIRDQLAEQNRLPPGHGPNGPIQRAPIIILQFPNGMRIPVPPGVDPRMFGRQVLQNMAEMMGPPSPFRLSEAAFEEWLNDEENFSVDGLQETFEELNFEENRDSERVHRMLLKAAQLEAFDAFSFFRGAFYKSIGAESGAAITELLGEITKPGKDPRFLQEYLTDCTPSMARDIGSLMTAENAALHQAFVDICGTKISQRDILKLVNVKLPAELAAVQQLQGSQAVLSVQTLFGATSDYTRTGTICKAFSEDANIQVYAIFSEPDVDIDLEGHNDIESLISVLSSLQDVHFAVVHLDLNLNKASLILSSGEAGPLFGFLHAEAEGNASTTDALDAFLSMNQEGLEVLVEDIKPGDVIIGVSEGFLSLLPRGFRSDVLGTLGFSFCTDTVAGILDILAVHLKPLVSSEILVGIVPTPEGGEAEEECMLVKVEEKEVKEEGDGHKSRRESCGEEPQALPSFQNFQ